MPTFAWHEIERSTHAMGHASKVCSMKIKRWCMLGAVLVGTLLASGCSLPAVQHPASVQLPEPDAPSELSVAIEQMRARDRADDSDSGIYALTDAQEAFAARALLARAAQHSLDVQYYIWRADKTGRLLLNELLMAADRGVQVRLLLDDLGTAGLDAELLALNAHPHVQVRLFNPFVLRGSFKLLGFVTEFNRTNRRMHNKSWTADRQASIVGGRNVGNEYFGATDGILFSDLDVITLGPVVQDIAQDFERYWRNAAAYPVEQVVTRAHDLSLEGLRKQGQTLMQAPASMEHRQAIASTPFVQQMLATTLPLEWAKAHLVSDPPEKIQARHKLTP